MKVIRYVYDWMGTKVQSPLAIWWLAGLFFIESSFFFIPVDPLLILFCIEDNRRSFYYAAIASIASVFGGMFGYFIGFAMWNTVGIKLVEWIISQATFDALVAKYTMYESWAVFIAGFTPIPYKAVTISAGFCKLPFVSFVVYSFLARSARFFLVAGVIRLWGNSIKVIIDRYFNYLVVAFTILLLLSCSVLKGAV